MHTTVVIRPRDGDPEIFEARIHHNGDWSGDAIVHWIPRGDGDEAKEREAVVPAAILMELVKRRLADAVEHVSAALSVLVPR